MARNVTGRLSRLNQRRRGTDRLNRVAMDSMSDLIAKAQINESWEKRVSTSQPYTRYALGAMQEVGPDYTRISLETGRRIGEQLDTGLTALGFSVDFRLQGSVALNVHIRGVSDVDILLLDTGFLTFAPLGRLGQAGSYYSPSTKNSLGVLTILRQEAEKILKAKYPAAMVDCSGGKAINISGGSLARPVDVVPSHWFDNVDYQASRQEHDRSVTILNKSVPTTLDNLPFLHIKRVHDRDTSVFGSLKKAIRLCKHVKNDAEDEGTEIDLPSFDIAAAMYYADLGALRMGSMYELRILAETQRHLDWLTNHEGEAKKLLVPDGSRPIFNTSSKLVGLRKLSVEMDDLMQEVAKEQRPSLALGSPAWSESRDALSNILISAAS